MKHLLRLTDYTVQDVEQIFSIADEVRAGAYKSFLKEKSVVMFLPESSIRTRITFEKGIHLLGGQPILFPPATLDKKEKIEDVTGYLNNWADAAVVRHRDINVLNEIARYASFPVINAMTDSNHPCEMLADMYSLSKIRKNFLKDKFLFVGPKGNIGLALKEAAKVMGFDLTQSCPIGYEIEGIPCIYELDKAILEKDIICTDSLAQDIKEDFKNHQITKKRIELANQKGDEHAILNPCPPFFRGEEVSQDVIESEYFVGYEFKKYLLEVQQAVLIYSLL